MSAVAGWGLAWLVVALVVGVPIGRYLKRRRQRDSEPVEDVAIAAGVYRDRPREGT